MRAMMVSRHCSKDSAPAQAEAGPSKSTGRASLDSSSRSATSCILPLQWSQTDTSLFRGCEQAPPTALAGAGEAASPVGFPALPLAIAPGGHWHAAGEPATTAAADAAAPAAVATQLAKAAVPSPHHHAIHRRGQRALGCGGRSPGGAERARGPENAGGSSGRGEGAQRSASWRACRNHEPEQSKLTDRAPRRRTARKVPSAGLPPPPPPSWAWPGPTARAGGGGREREAGSCPSFLPLKSKSFPRGGARAASQAGSAVSHLGLGGARGLQAPRHRQAALPRDGGRGWPSGTRGHPVGISCLPLSGSGAGGGGGRAEGVADAGAAESESGGSLH